MKGHIDVVKLLLNANANMETAENEYGRTPLSWAAAQGHVDVVKNFCQGFELRLFEWKSVAIFFPIIRYCRCN